MSKAAQGPRRDEHRTRAVWARRVAVAVACLGALAALVFAWMPKPVLVETAVASRGALETTIEEDGRARVKDRYVISAPLAGRLARIELHAGDRIRRGDVVARLLPVSSPLLDPRSRVTAEGRVAVARAAVRQAKAALERAEATERYAVNEAKRLGGLARSGAASAEALDRAEYEAKSATEAHTSAVFGVRVAEYELEMATAVLGRLGADRAGAEEQLDVASPVDGQVLRILEDSEGVVQPGQPLLEVGDPTALEIVSDVLTSDAVKVRAGQPARVTNWGGDDLAATVRMVEPSAFTKVSALGVEEQRVNVILDLAAPKEAWSALGDGYRVDAAIIVWAAADVLRVPATAVFPLQGGWGVYAVRDGVARAQSVRLGGRGSADVEVTSGLSAGDVVVNHPSERVHDGVRVDATP